MVKRNEKEVRPEFSMKMSDKSVEFSVEVINGEFIFSGTPWSEIKTIEDLSRMSDIVDNIASKLEMEKMCGTFDKNCEEGECNCVPPALACC